MAGAKRTDYALVGAGGRALMFIDPLAARFGDDGELVGLCDVNPARLDYYARQLIDKHDYAAARTFAAEQFDQMIEQTRPDMLIVCTVDDAAKSFPGPLASLSASTAISTVRQ